MATREIKIFPDPVLRAETKKIDKFDDELQKLVSDMFETMYFSDGIGLAAPQIGVSQKVVVIDYHGDKYTLVNPVITKCEGSVVNEEGCLSFPGIYEKVSSPEKISVDFYDEKGNEHSLDLDGFIACVFCHEIDHLNGRMLIDRVSPVKKTFIKKKLAKREGSKR
ncbi:MAG: peptide deformylase [Synergistes sp.]|nr:peptide deformylase [Synergistes sp.]